MKKDTKSYNSLQPQPQKNTHKHKNLTRQQRLADDINYDEEIDNKDDNDEKDEYDADNNDDVCSVVMFFFFFFNWIYFVGKIFNQNFPLNFDKLKQNKFTSVNQFKREIFFYFSRARKRTQKKITTE